MNVTELARQLRTTKEELLKKLPGLGFDIGGRAIKVDNILASRIREAWSKDARRLRLVDKLAKQQLEKKDESIGQTQLNRKINLPEKISVSELAEMLNIEVTRLIGYLMKNGIMASLSEQIDFDTASIVAEDHGYEAVKSGQEVEDTISVREWRQHKQDIAQDKDAVVRAPVVVVMGHVDHGKTTLLDAIRKTNVVGGESGGITQHIGAYQTKQKGKVITFLDTPGHEAFKTMRERGGQVADMAILVVAADDGLKPQTLESIKVIQQEKLPFVVAINKIDKPGADIDKVKKELSEINLQPEDWGGKTITVPVSAKKGENVSELLDMVLLVTAMEKFSAKRQGPARGVIIESHISAGEGPVATVLVNVGTLCVGDEVCIGDTYGKIKALKDWRGQNVAQAIPSMPVKILGLKSAPRVGDILRVEEISREQRKNKTKNYRFIDIDKPSPIGKDEADEAKDEQKGKLEIILKADVLGSLEALTAAVKKLESEDVSINIVKQGLGNITESDISLAEGAGVIVYGFNVQIGVDAKQLSYSSKAEIKIYKIIYELIDDIKGKLSKLVKTEIVRVPQGELAVLKIFKDSRAESIIGGRVKKAKISGNAKFNLLRNGQPIDEGHVLELQQNRRTVSELAEGVEGGVKVAGPRGFKEGDILSFYIEEEKKH